MRILHASLTREWGGSERYCASLAAGQADEGHDVRVVIRDAGMVGHWQDECKRAHVWAIPHWVPSLLERWVVAHYLRGFRPDVVHTHLGRADVKVGKVAKAKRIPWVTTVHLRWKPKDMQKADAAVLIAKWQKQEVTQAGYTGLTKVVWNWLPKLRVAGTNRVEEIRKEIGAGPKTVVFGSVGRLHGQKGMDVLVKAFRDAFDEGQDVRLVLVGEGPEKLKLQGLAGTDKRIHLVGHQPEISPWYEAMDVYVSASRYEPFGLTILEAMAHGCQLVCTRTEGPSEFLQEASGQGQVMWAERGNAESLAAVLRVAKVQGRVKVAYDLMPFDVGRGVREIDEVYAAVVGK